MRFVARQHFDKKLVATRDAKLNLYERMDEILEKKIVFYCGIEDFSISLFMRLLIKNIA